MSDLPFFETETGPVLRKERLAKARIWGCGSIDHKGRRLEAIKFKYSQEKNDKKLK